ncbi:hypothetical protein HDU98_011197 [Podochytrium sp. JEL0797]|nr:hypothetical protein HDU98_011197 [Podochytrium sp. JEL0797]
MPPKYATISFKKIKLMTKPPQLVIPQNTFHPIAATPNSDPHLPSPTTPTITKESGSPTKTKYRNSFTTRKTMHQARKQRHQKSLEPQVDPQKQSLKSLIRQRCLDRIEMRKTQQLQQQPLVAPERVKVWVDETAVRNRRAIKRTLKYEEEEEEESNFEDEQSENESSCESGYDSEEDSYEEDGFLQVAYSAPEGGYRSLEPSPPQQYPQMDPSHQECQFVQQSQAHSYQLPPLIVEPTPPSPRHLGHEWPHPGQFLQSGYNPYPDQFGYQQHHAPPHENQMNFYPPTCPQQPTFPPFQDQYAQPRHHFTNDSPFQYEQHHHHPVPYHPTPQPEYSMQFLRPSPMMWEGGNYNTSNLGPNDYAVKIVSRSSSAISIQALVNPEDGDDSIFGLQAL